MGGIRRARLRPADLAHPRRAHESEKGAPGAAVRTFTGRCPLVFPSARHAHRAMSENAIGYLLNRAGYHGRYVPHGWRATFSSTMHETHRLDQHVIDLMLAHAPKDKTEAAYDRAIHSDRQRELAQLWADLPPEGAMDLAAVVTGRRR